MQFIANPCRYLFALFFLVLPGNSFSQEQPAPPEVASEATPESFRDVEAGFSVRLAGGFRFLARQESLTLFGSNETPGVVFVESGETFTEQELAEAARSGYSDEGVALVPDGPASRLQLALGVGIAFPVRGTLDNQAVQGYLAGLRTPAGRCFMILVATSPASWPRLAPSAQRIIAGIELFQPQAPPVDQQTRAYFAGRRLSFYFSRSSFSSTGAGQGSFNSTEKIYLCSDGAFFYGEQTTASFDVPQAMGYSRTGDNSSGRWSAVGNNGGAQLTLAFHDGRQWRYQATRLGSEVLYLNGSKYFRAGQSRCR